MTEKVPCLLDNGILKPLYLHDTYSEITSKIYSLIKKIKEAQ